MDLGESAVELELESYLLSGWSSYYYNYFLIRGGCSVDYFGRLDGWMDHPGNGQDIYVYNPLNLKTSTSG